MDYIDIEIIKQSIKNMDQVGINNKKLLRATKKYINNLLDIKYSVGWSIKYGYPKFDRFEYKKNNLILVFNFMKSRKIDRGMIEHTNHSIKIFIPEKYLNKYIYKKLKDGDSDTIRHYVSSL